VTAHSPDFFAGLMVVFVVPKGWESSKLWASNWIKGSLRRSFCLFVFLIGQM